MPDAGGNIKGIALSGKAGEILEKIKRNATLEEEHTDPACPLSGSDCVTHRRAYPECGCINKGEV